MPDSSSNKVGDTVRGLTRKALAGEQVDRAALRRVGHEFGRSLKQIEQTIARDLRVARRAGQDAAAQSVSATLVSGAMLARVAAGLLAGVADSLARRAPRSPRSPRRR